MLNSISTQTVKAKAFLKAKGMELKTHEVQEMIAHILGFNCLDAMAGSIDLRAPMGVLSTPEKDPLIIGDIPLRNGDYTINPCGKGEKGIWVTSGMYGIRISQNDEGKTVIYAVRNTETMGAELFIETLDDEEVFDEIGQAIEEDSFCEETLISALKKIGVEIKKGESGYTWSKMDGCQRSKSSQSKTSFETAGQCIMDFLDSRLECESTGMKLVPGKNGTGHLPQTEH